MIKKIDINLEKKPALQTTAVREIYFGGERIRRIQIFHDSLGKAHTVRVIYNDKK